MVSSNVVDLLSEMLRPLGTVSVRRMFGGAMVYVDGVALGLLDGDVLYLKADDTNKGMFEAEGQGPFVYEGKTRPVAMSYWRVPERLYDEPDEMAEWARAALEVARRATIKKTKTKPVPKVPAPKTVPRKTPTSKKPASKSSRRKS
jgi:DNA transformation protein and related proteins